MKTKMLDWFRSNWFVLTVLVIAFIFLTKWGTGYYSSQREIRDLNDSIEQYDRDFQLKEEQLMASREIVTAAMNEVALYQDSLISARTILYTNRIRHAEEVANLSRIPTDSLYRDVTTWLDNLSFD